MFVVFEGIDGSGKTTISNQVAQRLGGLGLSIKHLRADGKFVSAVSEAIRTLGRDAKNLELVPQTEFLLYVARDVQLIEQALRPAMGQTDIVIADRFLFTAENLGRYGRKLSAEWIAPILKTAASGLVPDLVVLVDVDPVLARARRKAAKLANVDTRPPSRKGLAGAGMAHRLRRGYLEMAAKAPERWVVVNNEEVLEDLVGRVTQLLHEAKTLGVAAAIQNYRSVGRQPRSGSLHPLHSTSEALAAFLRWVDLRSDREPRVAAYLLGGLWGPGVDERRRALADRVPDAVLAGLSGLDDDASWELRERFRLDHPRAVAQTLGGLPGDNPRVMALRLSLEKEAPAEVANSLAGLDDEPSWSARGRLYDRQPGQVVASLGTLGSDRAWSLRERWLEKTQADLDANYEAARASAKSVAGLDDPRAWKWRERALPSAPVAALASLEGLLGPRSWKWRAGHLASAPKVVMGTLRGVRDARAWEMRREVAGDCKEALDSIVGLDDAEAWDMREAHADTWPSTVVKTLGPLSSGERGRALVERQLAAYPGNVSLLKHAAAVALGNRRAIRPLGE